MNTLVSRRIYDYVLSKLNDNSYGIVFSGNYVFKFQQQLSNKIQQFHILDNDGQVLEDEAIPIVPFVNSSNIEIPFNEKNKRSDYEVEYYLTIKTENVAEGNVLEFDTNDDSYQAMLETYKFFKDNLSHTLLAPNETEEDIKISCKIREPQKVNVLKFNSNYYQMFALTLNISKLQFGRFGNEAKLYLGEVDDPDFGISNEGDYFLDTIDWTLIMSKDEHNATKTEALNRQHRVLDRVIEIQATVNYDENTPANQMLMNELIANTFDDATETNEKEYKLRILQSGSFDKTFNVYVSTGNISFKPTTPETYTVSFKSKGE